jgi:iron(III) transport system substrate-binding protein
MKMPKIRARLTIGTVVLTATALLVAGCSGGSPTPDATVADPGADRIRLAQEEGSIVWYSGFAEGTSNIMAQGFEAETGVKVEVVRLGGEEVYSRVMNEASVGAAGADVVTTGDAAHFEAFKQSDLLVKFTSVHDDEILPEFKDPDGYYYSPYMLRFGVGYNTDVVSGDAVPTSWAALAADDTWSGQIVTSNPAFSVGAAAVPYFWDQELAPGYIDKVAALRPQVFQSVADALAPVETGEKAISLTAPYYLIRNAIEDGSPVDTVFMTDGVPVTLAGTGILKSATHPNAAAAFTDYLMSAEGQQVFADDNRDVGNTGVTYGDGYVKLTEIENLIYVIDPTDFADDIERIRAEFTSKFGV